MLYAILQTPKPPVRHVYFAAFNPFGKQSLVIAIPNYRIPSPPRLLFIGRLSLKTIAFCSRVSFQKRGKPDLRLGDPFSEACGFFFE